MSVRTRTDLFTFRLRLSVRNPYPSPRFLLSSRLNNLVVCGRPCAARLRRYSGIEFIFVFFGRSSSAYFAVLLFWLVESLCAALQGANLATTSVSPLARRWKANGF